MGNKGSTPTAGLSAHAKLAASKFDKDELHILKQTWSDLADRCDGKGIDKETFLQYFPLNGLMGERLFFAFDSNGDGLITFDNFVMALATLARGSMDARIHFIFNMCDVSHDNTITKAELETLLNQVPKAVMHGEVEPCAMGIEPTGKAKKTKLDSIEIQSDGEDSDGESRSSYSSSGSSSGSDSGSAYEEQVDQYTNHDIVEKCFQECDITNQGKLNYEQFKMWVTRTPAIVTYIESILPFTGIKDTAPHVDKAETLPLMHRRMSIRKSTSINQLDTFSDSVKSSSGSIKTPTSESSRGHSQSFLQKIVDRNSLNGSRAACKILCALVSRASYSCPSTRPLL